MGIIFGGLQLRVLNLAPMLVLHYNIFNSNRGVSEDEVTFLMLEAHAAKRAALVIVS